MLLPLLMNLGMFGESDDVPDDLWYVDAFQVVSRSPVAHGVFSFSPVAAQTHHNAPVAQEYRPE